MADTNRLAAETSLYLRQHERNPVEWYPWGDEAIAAAQARDVPIFLSVGYSACHWCHVMAHECFESDAIAAVMNRHFVNVKVDREERPDLDQIYMTALQKLTREGGGWPLSVFLTPGLKPFYAGTYFPPDERYMPQRPSFPRLLTALANAWKTQRDQLEELGAAVAEELRSLEAFDANTGPLTAELFAGALPKFRRAFDAANGGFGTAPKFPHAVDLRVLFRLAARGVGSDGPVRMVRLTLEKMARGGMYDQIGGGFHRYSVDAVWLVPHFEKMLYDNALLPRAYLDAYIAIGDSWLSQIARETLEYVLREMRSRAGGFYSTQDADSEGEEGKFFVWGEAELADVLGDEDARFARSVWGTSVGGNFEGQNILFRARSDADDAARLGLPTDAFAAKLAAIRAKLYARREERVHPGRDEKILASWNGLMIGTFAQAAAVLGEPRYLEAATAAAGYVRSRLLDGRGRLLRTCGEDHPGKLAGTLEDYAYLADGLVTLFEAGGGSEWLAWALELTESAHRHFADPAGAGFFSTADDQTGLIARMKDHQDGSTPSAGAVMTTVLLRLAALTGRTPLRGAAESTLASYRGLIADHPLAAGQWLLALDFWLGPVQEIAVIGAASDPQVTEALRLVHAHAGPNRVVAVHDPARPAPAELPWLADKPAVGGAVTVYVCENFACRAPLVGLEAVRAVFAGISGPEA